MNAGRPASLNKRDLVLVLVHQGPSKCVRFCCNEAVCEMDAKQYSISCPLCTSMEIGGADALYQILFFLNDVQISCFKEMPPLTLITSTGLRSESIVRSNKKNVKLCCCHLMPATWLSTSEQYIAGNLLGSAPPSPEMKVREIPTAATATVDPISLDLTKPVEGLCMESHRNMVAVISVALQNSGFFMNITPRCTKF